MAGAVEERELAAGRTVCGCHGGHLEELRQSSEPHHVRLEDINGAILDKFAEAEYRRRRKVACELAGSHDMRWRGERSDTYPYLEYSCSPVVLSGGYR